MVLRDKKSQTARPLSSFEPGDVFTTCGEYYMITDNNMGIQVTDGYRICVNIQSGAVSVFNEEYLVVFAPSEVYVE